MELFDKKFVYLEWDDKLKGKKVFIGDTLPQLRVSVNGHCDSLQGMSKNISDDSFYPFISPCGTRYAMVYYDPLYEYKQAYNQGKKVEVYGFVGISRAWIEVKDDWKWEENYEYRVKPETPDCYILSMSHAPSSVLSIDKNIYPVENKMILTKGTEEECKDYAVENYCKKCIHEVSICCSPRLGCQGFKDKSKGYLVALSHIVNTPVVHVSPVSKLPVTWEERYRGTESECIDYMVDNYCKRCVHCSSPNCSMDTCQGFKEVKKRRWTNRELAKWVAQGNGECMGDEIAMSCWRYVYNEADMPVKDDVQIRGWDETEWHEPEVEE